MLSLDHVSFCYPGRKVRQNHVSYVFQDFKLFPYMTAVENVLLAMSISKPHMKKSEAGTIACTSLKRLGLDEEDFDRKVARLSGGQQQRVAIARTLALDVDYILADEPTGALNKSASEEVMEALMALNREGTTILMVTHDSRMASRCGRILYMLDGRLGVELILEDGLTDSYRKREEKVNQWLAEMEW